MNILILTQWFNPEPNNMKAMVFAKGLKEKGHSVQVLTGFPNYPTGKIYQGYQLKLYQKEVMEDILIHRVILYPSHDSNSIKRSFNYLSFACSASLISPFIIRGKIDVIYVYHPPATVILPALLMKAIKKAKILLDINDLWPDTIIATKMLRRKWPLKILNIFMEYAYKKADKINVLSLGIKRILRERGVGEDKISTIPIWCNETMLHIHINKDFIAKYNLQTQFLGIYAGAMGRAQSLDTLVIAAKILQDKLMDFKLILIGEGICQKELKERVRKEEISNILFIPELPYQELTAVLNRADFLMIHLKKDPLFSVTIPSKLAYYMALGKPLVVGLAGEAADIIAKAEAGIICTPDDPMELAQGITKMYQMEKDQREVMGQRGKEYYHKHLSMDLCFREFEKVMLEMTGSKMHI